MDQQQAHRNGRFFAASDAGSAAYQEGASRVDVLFATDNGVAAVSALVLIPFLARRVGSARTHIVGLACGAAGFASIFLVPNYR